MRAPKLSLIVTSYDKERLNDISDLLVSLSRQKERDFELIYVTERDKSLVVSIEKIAYGLGLDPKLKHNAGPQGLSEARNLGLSMAHGEIVAFVDDDVVLSDTWTTCVISTFSTYKKAVCVTGPAHPLWVGRPLSWFPTDLDWLIGSTRWFRANGPVRVPNCWGMNMAFRRKALVQIGGFSSTSREKSRYVRANQSLLSKEEQRTEHGLMAEDVEVSLRLLSHGLGEIYYIPCLLVRNKVYGYRLSRRYVAQRASWVGYSRRNFGRLTGRSGTTARFEPALLTSLVRSLFGAREIWKLGLRQNLSRYSIIILGLSSLAIGYIFGPLED